MLLEKFANNLEEFVDQPGYECFNVVEAINKVRDEIQDMDLEDEDTSLDIESDLVELTR